MSGPKVLASDGVPGAMRPASCCVAFAALVAFAAPARAQPPLSLPVEGWGAAALVEALPGGTRPVVVVLHGNFDRPEWVCAAWAPIVRGRAFLLCPRGRPRADAPGLDRYELPAAHILAREVAAARAALEQRFPGRVADGPDVYVGFSQGAHRISRMAAAEPARYPRIQLVEGGYSLWREEGARRYLRRPGRVAMVCAVRLCETNSERLARWLQSGGASARIERIPAVHHDLVTMAPAIQRTFDWLVQDDPRFATPP